MPASFIDDLSDRFGWTSEQSRSFRDIQQAMDSRGTSNKCDLVVFVGTGVSFGATEIKYATWQGLLHHAIDYLYPNKPEQHQEATNYIENAFKTGQSVDLACLTYIKLSFDVKGKDYGSWMREIYDPSIYNVKNSKVLNCLMSLKRQGAVFVTTNYDNILCDALKLPPITWRNADDVYKALNNKLDCVVHIHGHYKDKNSIILDAIDYHKLEAEIEFQDKFKTALRDKNLLFIGCGSGLDDPHMSEVLKDVAEYIPESPWPAVYLIREKDYEPQIVKQINRHEVLKFSHFDDIPEILDTLIDTEHFNIFEKVNEDLSFLASKTEEVISPFLTFNDFKNQHFPSCETHKKLHKVLQDQNWALLSDAPSTGKTTTSLNYAIGQEETNGNVYYTDFAIYNELSNDDIDHLVSHLDTTTTFLIIDNAHHNLTLAKSLSAQICRKIPKVKIIIVATEVDAFKGAELKKVKSSNPQNVISVDMSKGLHERIFRYLYTKNKHPKSPKLPIIIGAETLERFKTDFGRAIGPFCMAIIASCDEISDNLGKLANGTYRLKRSAAEKYIKLRMKNLTDSQLSAMLNISAFSTQELEMPLPASLIPNADDYASILNTGLIYHNREIDCFVLKEPEWGGLIYRAYSHTPAEITNIRHTLAAQSPSLLVEFFARLKKIEDITSLEKYKNYLSKNLISYVDNYLNGRLSFGRFLGMYRQTKYLNIEGLDPNDDTIILGVIENAILGTDLIGKAIILTELRNNFWEKKYLQTAKSSIFKNQENLFECIEQATIGEFYQFVAHFKGEEDLENKKTVYSYLQSNPTCIFNMGARDNLGWYVNLFNENLSKFSDTLVKTLSLYLERPEILKANIKNTRADRLGAFLELLDSIGLNGLFDVVVIMMNAIIRSEGLPLIWQANFQQLERLLQVSDEIGSTIFITNTYDILFNDLDRTLDSLIQIKPNSIVGLLELAEKHSKTTIENLLFTRMSSTHFDALVNNLINSQRGETNQFLKYLRETDNKNGKVLRKLIWQFFSTKGKQLAKRPKGCKAYQMRTFLKEAYDFDEAIAIDITSKFKFDDWKVSKENLKGEKSKGIVDLAFFAGKLGEERFEKGILTGILKRAYIYDFPDKDYAFINSLKVANRMCILGCANNDYQKFIDNIMTQENIVAVFKHPSSYVIKNSLLGAAYSLPQRKKNQLYDGISRMLENEKENLIGEVDDLERNQRRISLIQFIGCAYALGWQGHYGELARAIDLKKVKLDISYLEILNFHLPDASKVELSQMQFWLGLYAISKTIEWELNTPKREKLKTLKLLKSDMLSLPNTSRNKTRRLIYTSLIDWLGQVEVDRGYGAVTPVPKIDILAKLALPSKSKPKRKHKKRKYNKGRSKA